MMSKLGIHIILPSSSSSTLHPLTFLFTVKLLYFIEQPSAPTNLSVSFVDQSTVILSWHPPSNLGGRTDTIYRIVCDACGQSVSYSPSQASFNDTKVTISGLNPVTTYRFQVFAENGVSAFTGPSEYVDITVTTEASGSFLENITFFCVSFELI